MSTIINTSENNVSITQDTQTLTITNNNNGTTVSVKPTDNPTVTIAAPGPAGPTGPAGSSGGVTSYSELSGIPSGIYSSSLQTLSNITASGNIEVGEDLFVSRYIRHIGDADTHIQFLDNKLQLHAGNIPFIQLDKDASTPYPLTINHGGNRVNFRVVDKNSDLLLKTDSEAFKVNLYHAGNMKLETTTDGIHLMGNISGSANSTGSFSSLVVDGASVDFSGLPTSDPGVAGRLYNDSGTIKISL